MTKQEQNNINGSTGFQAEGDINIYNKNYASPPKNRSIIAEVVNVLSKMSVKNVSTSKAITLPAKVQEKIEYNNLSQSKSIIEKYKDNTIDLSKTYETIEQIKPGSKRKVQAVINDYYQSELTSFNTSSNINSDEILENITSKLSDSILNSSNLSAYNEDVHLAAKVIIADAFIECLILKNPMDEK